MNGGPRRIGILAGGGNLPREIADCARARGQPVHIVALDGEADGDFSGYPVTHVNWGQVGRMIAALKASRSQDLVIVGRVRRPDVLRVRPDFGFVSAIAHIAGILAAGGDDGVLRAVIRFFESKGLRIIGPAEAAPELVIGEGSIGGAVPADKERSDIEIGFSAVRAMGPFDIGQAVVVADGAILAIEGAEGTDGMLLRVARQRGPGGGQGRGVLVKRPKPGQDLRIDLPAVGPHTVELAAAAGLAGIAVMAGQVLAAERPALVAAADRRRMFVAGIADRGETRGSGESSVVALGAARLLTGSARTRDLADARRAAEVAVCLARLKAGRGVVTVRRYVLAVEAGEGLGTMVQRAAGLRQWGSARFGRRAGALALCSADDLTPELVDQAGDARLAGIAVLRTGAAHDVAAEAIAAAVARRLFVVSFDGGLDGPSS